MFAAVPAACVAVQAPRRLLLCQPEVAGESTALLGFGTSLVDGERTGELLTFRSGRLHYTIAEEVLS